LSSFLRPLYFEVGFYISVSAASKEELDDLTKTVRSICRRYMVTIDVVSLRQEAGISSVLPFSNDKVKLTRKMVTDAAAILLPFSAQNLFAKKRFYYGKNSITNTLIILDRNSEKNSNGFILGKPGSGKSMKAKREIIDVMMLTDDHIIILDPEREFTALAQALGGEVIYLSPSTDTHINPFDIMKEYADGKDPIPAKSDFILTIIEILKGSKLTPQERAIIDRCTRLSYKEFIEHNWDDNYLPTFETFYDILKKQEEAEAKDLALWLQLYVVGSYDAFAKKTNVNLKNRLVVFDLLEIGSQLKEFGMQIVLDFIWMQLIRNKKAGFRTKIDVDECYIYFKDESTAKAFKFLYKRDRKFGGSVTGISQNITELLESAEARLMLSNSEFMILLDQSATDRAQLIELLQLSETQAGYLKNVEKGSGLIVSGKRIIPFNDEYPKDNKIYEIYEIITTDPKDVKRITSASSNG